MISFEQVISPQEPSVVVDNYQQLDGQQQHKKSVLTLQCTSPPRPMPPTRTSSQSVIDRIDLKRAASNSDDKIAVNIDNLNESIYKINNFIRLTKDIDELKREYSVRSNIKRNFSLKEQWLRNSGDNITNSAQQINDLARSISYTKPNPPVSQSAYDLRRTSLDDEIKSTRDQFITDRIRSESIHNLQLTHSTEDDELDFLNTLKLSDKEIYALSHSPSNKLKPKLPPSMPTMRKIEAQNFSSIVKSIKTQLPTDPQVTISTKPLTDISRFFPKKEATRIATHVNKNQKELKDVDLRKYFVPSLIQEESTFSLDSSSSSKKPISKQENNCDSAVSLYDHQLDGACDVKNFQPKQQLSMRSKSFNNHSNIPSDDTFFNQLVDDDDEIVEQFKDKEYNNLFDNLSIDAGSNIEEIFDEVVASEVILLSNKHQKKSCPPKIENENKCLSQNQKIKNENFQHFFGPKLAPNQIDNCNNNHVNPKDLTYRESAPKWHKKQIVKQTDVNDLYISKLPTKLQQQIKYLENQLAATSATDPLPIMDDNDLILTEGTPEITTEIVPKKVKLLKKSKNKIIVKKTAKKENEKNSIINTKENKSNNIYLDDQISDKVMDNKIRLLNEELQLSSANLNNSINKLNDIVEKTLPVIPNSVPTPTPFEPIAEPLVEMTQSKIETVKPPIRTLFKYKPLDGGVLQRHLISKSPMFPNVITNEQLLIDFPYSPQNGTLSNNSTCIIPNTENSNIEISSSNNDNKYREFNERKMYPKQILSLDNPEKKQKIASISIENLRDKQYDNKNNRKDVPPLISCKYSDMELSESGKLPNYTKIDNLKSPDTSTATTNYYHKPLERKLAINQNESLSYSPLLKVQTNDCNNSAPKKYAYMTSPIAPEKPMRRKINDESTRELIEQSKKIHNRKQEFMNAKMVSTNPYMKQMIENDDDVHNKLKLIKSSCYVVSGGGSNHHKLSVSNKTSTPKTASSSFLTNGDAALSYRKPAMTPTHNNQHSSTSRHLTKLFRRNPLPSSPPMGTSYNDSVSLPLSKKLTLQSERKGCNIS